MVDDSTLAALLEEQNDLLREILDRLNGGLTIKREYSKNIYAEPMTQEEKDEIDEEIDLDWWFTTYGEDVLPAKYMNRQKEALDEIGQDYYSKRELDYLHKRLAEIAKYLPPNEAKTHVFTAVGKKYCKAEKNSLNCFAFIPVDK